jgi:hypothetical protein
MIRVVTIACALAAFSSATFAQSDSPEGSQRRACHDDVQKFCAGIDRGGGRILDCLAANKDKLSDECRKRVEARGK